MKLLRERIIFIKSKFTIFELQLVLGAAKEKVVMLELSDTPEKINQLLFD